MEMRQNVSRAAGLQLVKNQEVQDIRDANL